MDTSTYRNDYPKKPIGNGNPYECCALCGYSVPSINGEVQNHSAWCPWRIEQETKALREVENATIQARLTKAEERVRELEKQSVALRRASLYDADGDCVVP